MLAFFSYVTGYLRIRVGGFAPERFMNLCSKRNIFLWDIRKEKDGYAMYIRLRDFYRLKPVVHKTKTRVVILKRIGLPFLVPFLLRRKIFVAGIVCSLFFWAVQSLFIWDIRIEGNREITEVQVLEFLQGEGVQCGMRKDCLDIEELEKTIRRRFPEVTWTSARLDGTKLNLFIKENERPGMEIQEKPENATDLVSQYSGTIISIVVRSGVPKVRKGDPVEQGTLLVEGKVPVYNEDGNVREYLLTQADADILIEHEYQMVWRLQKTYLDRQYTGRLTQIPYIQIGGLPEWKRQRKIPYLYYDTVMDTKTPALFYKLNLPVRFGHYTYQEYLNYERDYGREEAEEYFSQKLSIFLKTLEQKGVQIMKKNVKIETSGRDWVMEGAFLLREEAGLKKATDMGENILE